MEVAMINVPKYPRTMHWITSPGLQNDDRVHEQCEHFVGKEVVITNKMDGSNTCLHQGEVYARSTGQAATAGWFAMAKKYHAWKTKNSQLYFYGEDIAALHSIEYTIGIDETYFLFNILDGDLWVSWDELEILADDYGFQTVGVEFRGTFGSVAEISKWFETTINTPFTLGAREGFVMRIADEFNHETFGLNVAKYVRKGHVQTDQHWTKNWKWNELKDALYSWHHA